MSSFLMGYPHHHMQTPMGGMEPKFPPSEEYHLHHNGYGSMNGMTQNQTDYLHHQNNGLHQNTNNFNYSQGLSGHFYHHPHHPPPHHHHPGYASPVSSQMHSTSSPQSNGYTNNTPASYYGGYYSSSNNSNNSASHQIMDLPLQCPGTETTNTALGLQELGESPFIIHCSLVALIVALNAVGKSSFSKVSCAFIYKLVPTSIPGPTPFLHHNNMRLSKSVLYLSISMCSCV